MAGLLKSQKAIAKGAKLADPILQKVERGIEAKVPPELKKEYLKVVISGMRIMYDQKTSGQMVKMLQQGQDISGNVAKGIAVLIGIIYQESGKKMSIAAGAIASITLMAQALDFAAKTMGVQITSELVADCAKKTTEAVLAKFGIGREQIEQAVKAGQAKQGGQATEQSPMMGA